MLGEVVEESTVKVPWIIGEEVEIRDDVRVAGEEGSLSVKEMDDELLIGGVESKPRRQIHIATIRISHLKKKLRED